MLLLGCSLGWAAAWDGFGGRVRYAHSGAVPFAILLHQLQSGDGYITSMCGHCTLMCIMYKTNHQDEEEG